MNEARLEAMRAVKNDAKGTGLEALAAREDEIGKQIEELRVTIAALKSDLTATDGRLTKAREALQIILLSGGADRKKLAEDLKVLQSKLDSERKHYEDLVKQLRRQLNGTGVLFALAEPALKAASAKLRELEDQKIIPNTLPDIVVDRLARGVCICGTSVAPGTKGHATLCATLADAQQLGEHHEVLMHLNHTANRRLSDLLVSESGWASGADEVQREVAHSRQLIADTEKQVGELRAQIANIPERDVAEAEKMVRDEERLRDELMMQIARDGGRLATFDDELSKIAKERQAAASKEKKYLKRLAEERAANDLLEVITGTIETLQNETLVEVSNRMNDIFMRMIVADVESPQGNIRAAELTRDHDIIVHGPDQRLLDPDRDLSGAQRRALTLAFILALVRVSGVRAPNIVDTPLGMTSGDVRRAILRYAAENSTQLVLFLTFDEIHGVEDLLDQYTGRCYTFTHTDHYPKQVKNRPPTSRSETLVCDCDYRSWCDLCERSEVA